MQYENDAAKEHDRVVVAVMKEQHELQTAPHHTTIELSSFGAALVALK